jgi:hypothetical protein
VLGILAALAAVLSFVMARRSRAEAQRLYWMGYGMLAAVTLALWLVFR